MIVSTNAPVGPSAFRAFMLVHFPSRKVKRSSMSPACLAVGAADGRTYLKRIRIHADADKKDACVASPKIK